MAWVTTVTSAEAFPWSGNLPWGAIDEPVTGMPVYGDVLAVRGWALGEQGPPAIVEARLNGSLVAQCAPALPRPDIGQEFSKVPRGARSGFLLEVSIAEEHEFEVEVQAVLAAGETFPVGIVKGRRRWRDAPPPDRRVSVLIPCYNQARFLGDAISSVLTQSYRPLEVIVVDDGSTDAPDSVAASFGVRCIRQRNQGPAAARNAGLAAAAGDFIVYLDADNILFPHSVEAGLHAFEDYPGCMLVFGRDLRLGRDGKLLRDEMGPPPRPGPPGNYYSTLLEWNVIGSPDNVIFRRAAFDSAGDFDSSVDGAEDYDLYLRVTRDHSAHGHGVVVSGYRIHESQLSRDYVTMLRTVLTILRRQEGWIRASPALRDAQRRGIESWRATYGRLLTEDLRQSLSKRRWREAVRQASALLRWYRAGLWEALRPRPKR
jgi:glycosyltransferase involved in cell wall biosynthesis